LTEEEKSQLATT